MTAGVRSQGSVVRCPMDFLFNTFHPLCENAAGRRASERFGHPPFVDASCRREPDFEAKPPSISALCRGQNFAPRLKVGDVVVYATVLGTCPGNSRRGWRIVAVLQIARSFDSHFEAAEWYLRHGLALPSNCLVEGNAPLGIDQTARPRRVLEEWDACYHARASQHPVFHVGESLFLELHDPPVLTPKHMFDALGTMRPPSRTPRTWPRARIEKLLKSVGVKIDPLTLFDLARKTDVSQLPSVGGPGASAIARNGSGRGRFAPVRIRRRSCGGC